jgi:hypothetical protein
MKQFYSCELKKEFSTSIRHEEWVEYSINELIQLQAEAEIDCSDITDEEFNALVKERAKKIKDELMQNGIYKNVNGRPVFLYC